MADPLNPQDPNNPSVKTYGTPTGPGRNLQTSVNNANGVGEINEQAKELAGNAERVLKTFQNLTAELKTNLQQVDAVNDEVKELQRLLGRLNNTALFSKATHRDAARFFEDIREHVDRISKSAFLSPQSQRQVLHIQRQMADVMGVLAKNSEKAFDSDEIAKVVSLLTKMHREVDLIGKGVNNLDMSHFARGLKDINKALDQSFNLSSKFAQSTMGRIFTKGAAMQDLHRNLQNVAATRRERIARMPDEMHRGAHRQKLQYLGIDLAKAVKGEKHKSDRASARQGLRRNDTLEKLSASLSKRTGVSGFVDRKLGSAVLRRIEAAQARGEAPSPALQRAAGVLSMGKGSMLSGVSTGLGNLALGGVEGGVGGIASMAGRLAVPVGIAAGVVELAQKVYDKNALENRRAAGALGGGGLFTGSGPSAFDRLATARRNIAQGGAFNALGMNYEKSMKVAQEMANEGFSTRGLGQGNSDYIQQAQKLGPATGVLQLAQRNAFVGGANIGLDQTQSVQLTSKLIKDYHQSLQATEQFFYRIDKETSAAGISTIKYVGIIDGVTSSFDRWNKSLQNVLDTVSVLGRSGRQTAEDLQDMMSGLVGQKKDFNIRAYLNKTMMESGGAQDQVTRMTGDINEAADKFAKELEDKGIHGYDKDRLANLSPRDFGGLGALISQLSDPNTKKALGGQLDQLNVDVNKRNGIQSAINNRDFLSMATVQDTLGMSPLDQMDQNVAAINDALGHFNLSVDDLLNSPQKVFGNTAANAALSGVLQNNPKALLNVQQGVNAAKDTLIQGLQQGEFGEEFAKTMAEKFGVQAKPGEYKQAMQDFAKNNVQRMGETLGTDKGMVRQLLGSSPELRAMVHKSEPGTQAAAYAKAQQQAIATRPTAEVFSDAFEYLFQMLARPLNSIQEFIARIAAHFGVGESIAETQQVEKQMQGLYGGGNFEKAQENFEKKIAGLTETLSATTDPKEAAKVQAELAATKADLKTLQQYGANNPTTQQGYANADLVMSRGLGKTSNLQADQLLAAHGLQDFGLDRAGLAGVRKQIGLQRDENGNLVGASDQDIGSEVADMLYNAFGEKAIAQQQSGQTGALTLSSKDYKAQQAVIDGLKQAGLVNVAQDKDSGKTTITINNYDVNHTSALFPKIPFNKAAGEATGATPNPAQK